MFKLDLKKYNYYFHSSCKTFEATYTIILKGYMFLWKHERLRKSLLTFETAYNDKKQPRNTR